MTQDDWPIEGFLLSMLVMADAPEEAVKSYRKSVIGRGKPLTAKRADDFIRSARKAYSKLVPNYKTGKRDEVFEPATRYDLEVMGKFIRDHYGPFVIVQRNGEQADLDLLVYPPPQPPYLILNYTDDAVYVTEVELINHG